MSGRTWLMMSLVLALNWGGFVFCLWYGSRRAKP
jgi:arginine exporter protein ArgO